MYIQIYKFNLYNWLDCGHWTLRNNKCYKLLGSIKKTWENARIACRNNNATLASIPNAETENFLKNLSSGNPFWTGGKPCSAGSVSWCWYDGTPFSFKNWRDSCPKDGNDQRLRIDTEGNWCTKPLDSSEHRYYPLCQYEYNPDLE